MDVPETRFAPARGARIAYQDFGQTQPVVVAIPPMAQNVESAWEWPELRSMFMHFASFSRWIQFDKRGTGASDRRSRVPGIDERVEDLKAVMDHAGVERAFLYGASEGGPTCVLFAVTYPERVEGLILHGTGPYTTQQGLSASERDEMQGRHRYMADIWGTSSSPVAAHFAPSVADDSSFIEWHRRYERVSSDRASLLELLDISLDVDVGEVLPAVTARTLVMHRTEDRIIPVAWGRELAAGIPGAEMIEQEGADHFGFVGEREWIAHLERFVTGSVADRPAVRSTGSVLIRTFGGFGVDIDGEAVPQSSWGSRKARLLCKRLVAARGWPVLREELCEMLWPDSSTADALGPRLSVQLSHVRRILGGGVIADRKTVALDLSTVTTDVEIVLGSSDPASIVAAYRGEFLPTEVYEDWATPGRVLARSAFIDAARLVGERAIAASDLKGAASLAEAIIVADAFEDAGHRLAVRSSEDAASARRAHARWADAAAEIGVEIPGLTEI